MSDEEEESYEWVHWGDGLEKFTIDNAPLEDVLFELSTSPDVTEMKSTLYNPEALELALKTRLRPLGIGGLVLPQLNLAIMIEEASRASHAEMVEFLLRFGNNNGFAFTKLITSDAIDAAMKGMHLDILKRFHHVFPEFVDVSMGMGSTPLCQAISRGINQGLMPDTGVGRFNNLYTPIIQWLLENGADPNLHPRPDGSCLASSAAQSSNMIVALLLKYGAKIPGSWALHSAARTGRVDILELLYENGANIDEAYLGGVHQSGYFQTGDTPLHVAASYKQESATGWLLEHGALTDCRDGKGRTAFDLICGVVVTEDEVLGGRAEEAKVNLTFEERRCLPLDPDEYGDDWDFQAGLTARKAARSQRRATNKLRMWGQAGAEATTVI